MRFTAAFILVVCTILAASGCGPSTFIVSKEGRAFYFGRESNSIDRILCKTGDLEQILAETNMPDELKKDFYLYSCTAQRSREKIISFYQFLTPDEREDLKRAFRRYDYVINYVPC
ncbi:MAG: hypothetical protein HY755_06990 [Nitrospirae bacterium]|nr:hypothetical protein [Nitrospirota bacterium]